MNKRLQALMAKRLTQIAAMEAILNAADTASDGVLTAEDQAKYDGLEAELKAITAGIEREQRLIEHQRTAPAAAASASITDVHDRAGDAPFKSLGEQLSAIASHAMGKGTDPRLFGAASGASSGSGPDGGFLIQKDFDTDLTNKGEKSGELSSRCSSTEIGPNSDSLEVVTIDETSRATGSRWGGVRVYRKGEADTVTATKPKLDTWEARLEDMMGLAYATDRLLQDAAALGAVFTEAFTDEFGFKLDDEIYRGTGVGQCLGVIPNGAAAGPTVQVAKEAGQLADTIVAENIDNMWARVPFRSRKTGIWVYNVECEPQLGQMQVGTGTSAQLVFMPPGGLSQLPYATIKGRPAIPIEQASALGDVGDIAFLDLSQYKLITKGGIQADESMHVRFIYNERAFRWVKRVNGKPKWKSALTPYKGANTLSPFVVLAARA